jgi:filamentous hemagglutinin family protein
MIETMYPLNLKAVLSSILVALIPIRFFFLPVNQVSAQITPDSTLGTESSVVNQLNQLKSLIEGGALRGENLFHSFLEFNVGNGQSVYFVNPDGVNNILTRVTGDNISQIMGTLGVNGNANLFLLNPNGIIFGPNARLDLNGSFIATTGEIQLGEDGFFSATDIEGSSLLSVKPEAVFANFQGQIENRANLVVRDGQNIILMADKVVNRGNLIAPQGIVKLQGNEVVISGNSVIDVSGDEGAGAIAIKGTEQVNIGKNVSLTADALVSGDGGAIEITSQGRVEFLGNVSATGENPGAVTIDAPTVINHGVIDLGAEEDKEETAIASNSEPEKAIASQEPTQQPIVGANGIRPLNAIRPSQTQSLTANNPPLQPDESLGNENTQIEAIDENNDRVIGGAERGANLFHSFLEFNIETGKGVYFANPVGIDNILARVTGDHISEIRGTLGVEGSADLYFINPNGIFFHENASLDLNGSFFASTAEAITFDNFDYSAVNPNLPPNLVVSVPTGLRFGDNPGDIANQGPLITPNDLTLEAENLNLSSIIAASGNLTLKAQNTVTIRDSQANPFIAASGEDLLIQGKAINIFALNHPQSGLFAGGDLILRSPNPVIGDAHYWSRGNFRIEDSEGNLGSLNSIEDPIIRAAGDVSFNIYQGTSLHIMAGGSVNAGTIIITDVETGTSGIDFIQEAITLTDGTVVNIDGSQQATVDIRAGVRPDVIGTTGITGFAGFPIDFFADPSFTSQEPPPSTSEPATSADITIGDIAIIPENGTILLTNQYEPNLSLPNGDINILSSQGFLGRGIFPHTSFNPMAEIDLVAIDARGNVNIDGEILASSFSNQGGDVIINSQGNVQLQNGTEINVRGNEGGIIDINANNININNALVLAGIGEGLGFENAQVGDIKLDASENLTVDNSFVSNDVRFGATGNSGKVILHAQEITINDSLVASVVFSFGKGNSGGIVINTSTLTVSDGAGISASTFGEGNGGAIQITATDAVTLSGESTEGAPSFIFSQVLETGVGDSEGIVINTSTLTLSDGAEISASTFGEGNAGAIQITATDAVTLSGESTEGAPSFIASGVGDTGVGDSEGIVIDTSTLTLSEGAEIFANTFGEGNAGAIQITATDAVTLSGESTQGIPSFISSQVEETGVGDSEGIVINTSTLTLSEGAEISASTFGEGNAGAIQITATDAVTLSGESTQGAPSFIFSQVEETGVGDSEGIVINTSTLTLSEGAVISASTFGEGNGGAIQITATDAVTLSGESTQGIPNFIASIVGDTGVGDSEGIVINTSTLTLSEGAGISASTFGEGNAGAIQITATDAVTLSGESTQGIPSFISSQVEETGVGDSEGIVINTSTLTVSEGAEIFASTFGEGNAGAIQITATDAVTLSGESTQGIPSFISSQVEETGVGDSEGIVINTSTLTLSEGAVISASTFGEGNAGAIQITATDAVTLSGESTQGIPNFIASIVGDTGVGDSEGIVINTSILTLSEGAQISASTFGEGNAGAIEITATDAVTLSGKSTQGFTSGIFSEVGDTGVGDSEGIVINTSILTLSEGAQISASTFGEGNAGAIEITATDAVTLSGKSTQGFTSGIFSEVGDTGVGDSEGIVINTSTLTLSEGAGISASTGGEGNAGDIQITASDSVFLDKNSIISTAILQGGVAQQPANITIKTNTLTLDNGAEITASAAGRGEGGNITINTNTPLTLNHQARITSALDETGIGKGGNITINAPSLFLNNQSEINASTFGIGEGSFVRLIIDNQIHLDNASVIGTAVEPTAIGIGGRIEIDTQQLRLDNQSQLRASTLGQGDADSITIRANTVELINGSKIRTETESEFDAGNITLILSESLFISGDGSGLFANTEVNSTGDGGNITVNSPLINLENNAAIAVSSLGEGIGGDINITADFLNLDNSDITAQTLSTDGGNITLQIQEGLILKNGSNITASAGTASSGGDGGNIVINSPFILSIPSNPFNTITANAFEGDGGNINITTNAIFGGEFLVIDASSQLGLDGEVIINDPDVDPTSGLIIIEANFVDAESLIAQNPCRVENFQLAGGSSFIIMGKGGLPAQSADLLTNNLILTPWVELTTEVPLDSTSLEGEVSLSAAKAKTSLFSSIYCRLKN